MSSMLSSHTLNITGGTFTQAHGDVHYHGYREIADILHRATATAAFHNSKERFDPPKCHPNTRLAILTKIMKWIKWEDDVDACIMWLYGAAGAGKSAIAQTIAEMCEREMILLATFFFSRNDPSRNNVNSLIATLVYQITLNIPHARDAILAAIEHDPLIFSKSLAVQVESLIVAPLLPLAEAGFFNASSSRRLVIIDGLDECSDSKAQQNILEVLANAQQHHRLPLVFLFASRPEQQISLTFNTGLLFNITSRLALDESCLPDEDIELFLTDKFQDIKSTHRLRAYIPPQWPLPGVLKQLVRKSSGQFIYASTVIRYVASIRDKPVDRLDIILGIRPPQKDLPFSELDALYTHILAGVEDIGRVLEILGVVFWCDNPYEVEQWNLSPPMIENFLCLQPGDVELYLGDLNSLVTIEPDQDIRVLHASLHDFFVDPTRSKTFWINRQAQHTAFARRCLQVLQNPVAFKILWIGYGGIVHHLENAEMTPELCDDLCNFSFDKLWDVTKHLPHYPRNYLNVHNFALPFLWCLENLPSSEARRISHTQRVDFDRILCNALEKYHPFPGFALLLGSLLHSFMNTKYSVCHLGMVAYLCLVCQRGEGHIIMLNEIGFSGIITVFECQAGTEDFLAYLVQLLETPEQSGVCVFDQQRYTTAAKECLQLCLCNYHSFSKGLMESGHHDRALRRSKPSVWIARMGVRSRMWKARRHFKVQKFKSLHSAIQFIDKYDSFPENSPKHEYYRSWSYQWALDLLPFFLENSAISLELAEVLRRRTFTNMAWQFPQKRRLAKEAISRYLLRVESAVGSP